MIIEYIWCCHAEGSLIWRWKNKKIIVISNRELLAVFSYCYGNYFASNSMESYYLQQGK